MAEINYIVDNNLDNNPNYLSTNIKSNTDGTKLRLYFPKFHIPETIGELDKSIKARFGDEFGLEYALEQFVVAGVCTKPAYSKVLTENPSASETEQRDLCQDALDNWKPGRKSAGPKVAKADIAATKEAQNMAAALGLSLQELIALAAQLKK